MINCEEIYYELHEVPGSSGYGSPTSQVYSETDVDIYFNDIGIVVYVKFC